MSQQTIAPGHVFTDGNGIKWDPKQVSLWAKGECLAMESHRATSAWEFWHELSFAQIFPNVTHWWFGSPWTQKVRLTKVLGNLDDYTVWGYIQFVDKTQDSQQWMITSGKPIEVIVPIPNGGPLATLNIPLRVALSRMTLSIVKDEIAPDTWYPVTSLVKADDLDAVFPTTLNTWVLEGLRGTTLRDALCQIQNLQK